MVTRRTSGPASELPPPCLALGVLLCLALFRREARAEDARDRDWHLCTADAEATQTLRDRGELRKARSKALSCSRSVCPEVVRHDCQAWLAQLDEGLPTVVIRALDGDRDVTAVTVSVDGEAVLSSLDGLATPIDPGKHVFRFEAAGFAPLSESVLVAQGEKNRRILVRLQAPADDARPRPEVTAEGPHRFGPAFWTASAVGAAALASFAYFGISALSERSHLSSTCAAQHDCTSSDHDELRDRALAADISLGVGVVSAGVATWLAIRAPDAAPAIVASSTGMRAVWTFAY